jgi:hypothetical protein
VLDDDYRVVLDEESLAWGNVEADELAQLLVRLADLLAPLADGRRAAFLDIAYDVVCWQSVTLMDLLYSPDPRVPRDARVRLQELFQKCHLIDDSALGEQDIPRSVRFDGDEWAEPSWGVSHALRRASSGRGMSCLVVPKSPRTGASGWTVVECDSMFVDIHVHSAPASLAGFWRGLYGREAVPERDFFELAPHAFPELLFASSLRFNAFDGAYAVVSPWLVLLLGAVNDHFADAIMEHHGDQNQVIALFSAMGLDISPESPKTKHNAKAWSQRLVEYGGVEHRCEWHGKRQWDRDRVHFSLPLQEHDGRVLIGIFAEHLAT